MITKPKLEGSSHLFPLFSLSPDEAKVEQTNSQEHIFYNILSKVKLVSKKHNLQMVKEELVRTI